MRGDALCLRHASELLDWYGNLIFSHSVWVVVLSEEKTVSGRSIWNIQH